MHKIAIVAPAYTRMPLKIDRDVHGVNFTKKCHHFIESKMSARAACSSLYNEKSTPAKVLLPAQIKKVQKYADMSV